MEVTHINGVRAIKMEVQRQGINNGVAYIHSKFMMCLSCTYNRKEYT